MNRLAVTGLGLTVAGLLLVVGFWPLTSVSGADLLASRNGNQYTGYTQGSQITVHEKVVDVSFTNFFGNPTTTLEIEDGNPNEPTVIYVRGDARGVVSPGDVIFAYTSRPYVSASAFATLSSVDKGLQDASRTVAPASRNDNARTPVLASTWSAIPIRSPRRGFFCLSSSRIAASTGMWSRAHSIRRAPTSPSSDIECADARESISALRYPHGFRNAATPRTTTPRAMIP